MPLISVSATELDLPRNIAILDTNVLVAFADDRDQYHEQARTFFDAEDRYRWLVAPPVIVESCGVLMSRRNRDVVINLLRWLLTVPTEVIVFPSIHPAGEVSSILGSYSTWMSRYKVDYVDAYLMEVANRITNACDLRPSLPIVTFDTKDYLKCSLKGFAFSIYDMRDFELIEFS